jgi:hypothetical protein
MSSPRKRRARIQMRFHLKETDDRLIAIFDGEDSLRNSLLSKFLDSSKYFVVDILHDISRVEQGLYSSYAHENPKVFIELFKDHITIEPYIKENETEIPMVEIPLEKAKLLLFEWGVALQRWRMKRKKL